MKQTILVTGVGGFVGHHLAAELKSRDVNVIGVGNSPQASAELAPLLDQYISCDLTNEESVAALNFSNVNAVIHLAALASQGMSFAQPRKFIADNSAMVINIFERALAQNLATYPRFVMISSGAVYQSNQPMPLTEASATTFTSPYAISKLLGEQLGEYYATRGIQSVVVRPFNHTGPGQGPGLLIPDLTKQVANAGPNGTLSVGNLQTRRDYSDVRDIARAYADIALAAEVPHALYNACSGQSRSGQEVLNLIAHALYGDDAHIKTAVDQTRIRPNDPAEIYGSHQHLTSDFAWQPKIGFEQTITDYVDWFKDHPF